MRRSIEPVFPLSASRVRSPVFSLCCALLSLSAPSSAVCQPTSGTISGVVLTEVGEKPVVGAEVQVDGGSKSIRTDSLGRFSFVGVTIGAHRVLVRTPGFQPFDGTVQIKAGETLDFDVLLSATATAIEKREIVDTLRRLRIGLEEFHERKRSQVGKFLDASLFEKNYDRSFAAILRQNVSGIVIHARSSKQVVASSRGGSILPCYVQVYLNGVPAYNAGVGQDLFDISQMNTQNILGVEYYTVANTPLQFNATSGAPGRGSSCGTMVIWTK